MKRTCFPGEIHHIYQKTAGGVVVFYSMSDYLVFYTIYCTMAERMEIDVLALCPMPDHLHNAIRVRSREQLQEFVQQYTRIFAHEWNKSRKRKGSLFRKTFGYAAKLGNKAVRTTLNYNYNNPPERKIVQNAEDYRWNFLKYYKCRNPFSEVLHESHSSAKLRTALQELRTLHKKGEWVRYAVLDRWMNKLSIKEIQQLADYIVSTWNVIDYNGLISYYGSYESMIRSFHDNTGSEYDIREDKDNYSDSVYTDCTKILIRDGMITSVRDIPKLQGVRKLQLYKTLSERTTAKPKQLEKYLHLSAL